MKHIKKYNEAIYNKSQLKRVEDLDEEIKQIFLDITDGDSNLNLEVLHQNGSSTYTLYNTQRHMSSLQEYLKEDNNLSQDYIYERLQPSLEKSINYLSLIAKELPEIRGRVKDIIGLELFDITTNGTIVMTFRHLDQGYDKLGKVMLIGNPSKSMYY